MNNINNGLAKHYSRSKSHMLYGRVNPIVSLIILLLFLNLGPLFL
jgi:hypothetical protein